MKIKNIIVTFWFNQIGNFKELTDKSLNISISMIAKIKKKITDDYKKLTLEELINKMGFSPWECMGKSIENLNG